MKTLFTFLLSMITAGVIQAQFNCHTAQEIQCGQTVTGSNQSLCFNTVTGGYCGTNYNLYTAAEKVYRFTVTSTQNVQVQMSGLSADLDLFLLRSCCAGDCVAKSDLPPQYTTETVSANLTPGTYYIVIDGWSGASCSFNLTLTCSTTTGQPDCFNAVPLTCNQTVTSSTASGTNNIVGPYCNSFCNYGANEKVYSIDIATRSTVSIVASGFSGDLDMFLLGACNRNSCYAVSGNAGASGESIATTLDPGKYYVVLDGYAGAVSPFSLTYSCTPVNQPIDCESAIKINYAGNGSDLKFNYVFSAGPGYQFKQWRYNNTVLSSLANVNLLFQGAGTYNICADYINLSTGQVATCCRKSCISLPQACQDVIQYQYTAGVFKLTLAGNNANYQNISWRNDTDGVTLDPNNVPASCRQLLITVRYYDLGTNCWVLCCRKIDFCAPTSCQDNINYSYNGSTNSFQFTFNNPNATQLYWKFDDTNTALPGGLFTLPSNWTCADRTVSVYYFDTATQCWKVCCRRVTICPPVNCQTAINYTYTDNGAKVKFTLDVVGAGQVIWKFDDDGTVLPDGVFTIPQGWVCKDKVVSVYYFDPATQCWKVCCKKVNICPPQNCDGTVIGYQWVPSGNKYQFTLSVPNAQHVIWKFDDDGTVLPGGMFVIPSGWTCKDKPVSVYYFDPATQCWRVCCKKITICPPTQCEAAIQYGYNGTTNQFTFTLNIPGATNLVWKFDDDGTVLPGGTFTVPSGWSCQDKPVSVYYFDPATQCWKVCCKMVNICPPAECSSAIGYKYSTDGNNLQLTFTGSSSAQYLQWVVEETGQVINNSGATSVTVPVSSTCAARTFSVRYLENGVWKICCKRIYLCPPQNCQNNISQNAGTSSVAVSVSTQFTGVQWYNNTSGQSLGSGSSINLPLNNGGIDLPVVVTYYDPVNQYYAACFRQVLVQCTMPVASFTYTVAGAGVNFTGTASNGTSYSWNFDGGVPAAGTTSTSANPVAVFSSGTYNVCLTATNSCGSHTSCQLVTVNTGHDCTIALPKNVCGTPGSDVLVPVRVAKFNDVLTFNFTIRSSDPDKLTFVSVEQQHSEIANGSNHYIQPDHLRFFWSQASAKSLPDNSALFYIRCRMKQGTDTPVSIHFSDNPVKTEAYGGNLQKLNLELVNGEVCVQNPAFSLTGKVMTHTLLKPMSATEVDLTGTVNSVMQTGNTGQYTFGPVNQGSNVNIKPVKNTGHLDGVNALDIVRLQRHLLLIDPITSPYRHIAADVNNDKVVNALDVVVLQRMQLRLIEEFPNNTSWRFVPVSYQFTTSNPAGESFPESVSYSPLTADHMADDFYGIKVGDLDDSNSMNASLASHHSGARSAGDTLVASLSGGYVIANKPFTVDVKCRNFNSMSAFEGTITWDSTKVALKNVSGFNLPGMGSSNVAILTRNGVKVLTFNWTDGSLAGVTKADGESLFKLNFEPVSPEVTTTSVNWANQPLPVFAANSDLDKVTVKSGNASMIFVQPLTVAGQATDLTCHNSVDGTVVLQVSGGTGQYSYNWSDSLLTGGHLLALERGLYRCTVTDILAGLTSSAEYVVNAPDVLETNLEPVKTDNDNEWSISANVTGGTPPYAYVWSNGQTTATAYVQAPGEYNVIIIDANNCSVRAGITINNGITSAGDTELSMIKIAPNPADRYFTFSGVTAQLDGAPYRIFDGTGRITANGIIREGLMVGTEQLAPGLYFVHSQAGTRPVRWKLVVTR